MDYPYRVVTDVPLMLHSTHPTPGGAHKSAIALSMREGANRLGGIRVEKWTEVGGWVAIDTYVNGEQQEK